MSVPLWEPSPQRVAQANLTAFMRAVEDEWRPGLTDFRSLYRWSVERPEQFWASVWSFCGVVASRERDEVVVDFDRMPGAKWFVGSKLNFAENLLRYRDDREALVFWNESGRQRALTYADLYQQVGRLARSLRDAGVRPGDRVVGFLPNMPETVIAMLAAASLGAVWSSTSPDFGAQGVHDRFGQIEPKVLFTADGYLYNGKPFDSLGRVAEIVAKIPSIERVVVVPYLRSDPPLDSLPGAVPFEEFLAPPLPPTAPRSLPPLTPSSLPPLVSSLPPLVRGGEKRGSRGGEEMRFEQLPFDHPLYILYSSGTTGVPKCIVHGAGGTLLQHLKELVLHTDLKRDDRIFYFTTCGWMMWNWLVSSLAAGATVLLYDGSPFHPRPGILFDMAERERTTVFGTSARYLAAAEKAGLEPINTHDLSSLRTVLSTGSPLAASSFDYVYEKVKRDVGLSSISGGTDLISCFALGNPIGPVYRGELQTRGLGMKVLVYDDHGRPLPPGEKGELVCAAPFPSMPIGFWNDPDGQKYRSAYFEHFPGVWRHGDWVELTEHDGMIVSGRSDAVLNPGGVRIGTAEIYRQVEQLPEVLESLVVGQDWEGDVRIVLFVKLRPDVTLDEQLAERIKEHVRRNTTPRHVPKKLIAVADIPRTISGKIVELAVRNVVHGRPVKNRDALANPEALKLFEDLPELQC